MNKSKNEENQIHQKWLRKGLIFFKMQNFAPFSLFIIHRIMNSKFDAILQPVVNMYLIAMFELFTNRRVAIVFYQSFIDAAASQIRFSICDTTRSTSIFSSTNNFKTN